ncbi:RNA-directed DNA polymerase, eukaryota, reverse transcriptase zinc-binding domain protein [Tanacetum coccineum]
MVNWIMTCVKTKKFSICVNGEAHGYFNGERGLRQGDPISPYLFTLVMEVFSLILSKNIQKAKKFKFHYGCKDLKLSNMCFADDLLVLWKSIIFFGSVPLDVQRDILIIMHFQVGKLPMKYLGVPLIAKKLGVNDCKNLVNKISEKINCWKNKVLSYAGRIQLIASVLSSMQIYWASVYMLPSSTINEVEKLLKGFVWCQGPLTSGKAKVAWKQVCLPKEQGGLGIKSLKKWNEVLLIKQLWKIIEGKESLIKARVFYSIGDGRNVSMWFDKWDSNGPLCDIIPRREWYRESQFQPRHTFILWLATKERLATQDRIAKWNGQISTECPLCKKEKDYHEHLFFKCDYAEKMFGYA